MSVTGTFYNGKEWIAITSEEILDNNGNPTGHYKEIGREYINESGVFDDIDIMDAASQMIADFKASERSGNYLLYSPYHQYLFRVYYANTPYKDFGEAVILTLLQMGLPENFYKTTVNGLPAICFELRWRDPENSFNAYLISADKITIQAP